MTVRCMVLCDQAWSHAEETLGCSQPQRWPQWSPSRPQPEVSMSSTQTTPVRPDSDTGEGDGYAHYADKTEITRAAIEGGSRPPLLARATG